MTEADWLSCNDPTPMLEYLRGKASDRKLRLFAVACVKRVESFLREKEGLVALQLAERMAEGPVRRPDVRRATERAYEAWSELVDGGGVNGGCPHEAALYAAYNTLEDRRLRPERLKSSIRMPNFGRAAFHASVAAANSAATPQPDPQALWTQLVLAEQKLQTALLHDIVGNPFSPLSVDLSWLTPNITALAATIYEERAFDRTPVLADALEEAGCDNADILSHCRRPGEHVRGCWAVDLILRRE